MRVTGLIVELFVDIPRRLLPSLELYDSYSCSVYKGKAALGEIRLPAGQALAESKLGLAAGLGKGAKLPVVVAVCNGDLRLVQKYSGDMKGEALRKWLGESCQDTLYVYMTLDSGQSSTCLRGTEGGVKCTQFRHTHPLPLILP